jgi:hypothetical protein
LAVFFGSFLFRKRKERKKRYLLPKQTLCCQQNNQKHPPVENFSTITPSNVENLNKPLYYLTKTPDKLPSNCGKPCGTVENNCGKAPSNPLKIPLKPHVSL